MEHWYFAAMILIRVHRNLSDQSYEDIINGKKMIIIRQAMESGIDNFICRKCFAAKNVKY